MTGKACAPQGGVIYSCRTEASGAAYHLKHTLAGIGLPKNAVVMRKLFR
jgi:hypothetical protein